MKNRIFKNWTFTRLLFLTMGIIIMIQAIYNQQLFGIVFGAYFASMGLFAFGCASGNCLGGKCVVENKQKPNQALNDIEFEEVK
ncbi:MAG: hypothetical protein Q8K70_09685 [Bacteroidota bacterium]|nr:hypothetical protein [Bacteroidota bacterium]